MSHSGVRAFPWRRAMAIGLGLLRLPPEAFWAMTPRELAAALEGLAGTVHGGDGPPTRADLEALMRGFPDAARPRR